MIVAPMKKTTTVAGVQYNKNTPDVYEVKAIAQGHWRAIHAHHGIITPTNFKNAPCPKCGGDDRYSNRKSYDETGDWFCRGGGNPQSGDGIGLIMHASNINFPEALISIADYFGFDGQL